MLKFLSMPITNIRISLSAICTILTVIVYVQRTESLRRCRAGDVYNIAARCTITKNVKLN